MKKIRFLLLMLLSLLCCALLLAACDEEPSPPDTTVQSCDEGHAYGEPTVQSAPGCTETGTQTRVCTRCGVELTESIPAVGHVQEGNWQIDLAATCTADGARHKACLSCGKTLVSEVIKATGHSEGAWQTDLAATCTAKGSKHTACTVCETVMSTQEIPKTAHVAVGGWQVLRDATCTQAGEQVRKCTCGHVTNTMPISPKGHANLYWVEEVKNGAATDCMEERCGRCNALQRTEKKEKVVQTSVGATSTNLKYYTHIVYPTDASTAFADRVGDFARRLYAMTGVPITAVPDSATPVAQEILIGRVNRPESIAAAADIVGHGYTVQCKSGKIVITGSTDLIALMGVAYFEDTYMQGSTTSVRIPQKAISDRYLTVTLADDTGIRYVPVYNKDLDTDGTYKNNTDPETEYGQISLGTGRDYAYDAALLIRDALLGVTGESSLALKSDATAPAVGEIQIGFVDRAASYKVLLTLEGGDYAIAVCDGTLVLAAHSTAAMRVAAPRLAGYLADAVYTDGLGNRSIVLPQNFSFVEKANDNWFTGFEKPDGLTLTGTEDAGDSSLQYYYKGATKASFTAYLQKLAAAGYTVLTQSEEAGSCFATLVSADGKNTLHVSFDAFAHAANSDYADATPALRIVSATLHSEYGYMPLPSAHYKSTYPSSDTRQYTFYNREGQSVVTKTFFTTTYRNLLTKASNGYKIVFESTIGANPFYIAVNEKTGAMIHVQYGEGGSFSYTENEVIKTVTSDYVAVRYTARGVINLPTAQILNPTQTYEKKTDAAITSVVLQDVGTGYIITLEDGSFVILDGGTAKTNTPERLWAILVDLHTKIWGEAPSEERPVHIAAWFFSHSHSDHINAFWDFANFYGGGNGGKSKTGGKALVKVDYLLANTPESAPLYNTGGVEMTLRVEMRKIHNYYKHGFTFIKVHTGQKLYFANMELHVMYTHEDLHPTRIVTFNDTSTMPRLTFTPTQNGVKAGNPVSLLFTGDAYLNSARWMCAMYGEKLHSDMVTLSHHGGPGTGKRFYELISADVLWWPHLKNSVYGGYLKQSSKGDYIKDNQHFYREVDQYAYYMESVDYVYISDVCNITLYLRANGPDYANIYTTAFVFTKVEGTVTDVTVQGQALSYYELSKTPSSQEKTTLLQQRPVAVKKVED